MRHDQPADKWRTRAVQCRPSGQRWVSCDGLLPSGEGRGGREGGRPAVSGGGGDRLGKFRRVRARVELGRLTCRAPDSQAWRIRHCRAWCALPLARDASTRREDFAAGSVLRRGGLRRGYRTGGVRGACVQPGSTVRDDTFAFKPKPYAWAKNSPCTWDIRAR